MTQASLVRWASRASLVLALFLIAIHVPVYALTGSMAVFSSLMESVGDAFASAVAFAAVRVSQQDADGKHSFGYGKAESLGSLVLCGFIALTSLTVIKDSTIRLWQPVPLANENLIYWMSSVAMVATFGLVWFQKWVLSKTANSVIEADHIHYKGHLLAYASMVSGALLAQLFGFHWADSVAGILISVLMLLHMWPVATNSYHVLMDRELDENLRQQILGVIQSHPYGTHAHGLKTRRSGDTIFLQFHLEFKHSLTLSDAHSQAHAVVDTVKQHWPNAEVLVHAEPFGAEPHY